MQTPSARLNIAFDIGHSSIGWAVLQPPTKAEIDPSLLGCGVVLFPADECLSSARAGFRRQRRHIAATRNRIKRLKTLLNHLGVLSEAQLNQHPSPYSSPWLFAARVLASKGQQTLSWPELWAVLRWYAHNRGYDGNAAWAKDAPEADDDTKKVETAKGLMAEYKKETMAETVCAYLGLDPLGGKLSSTKYFKGANAAFPRDTVAQEVRRILEAHRGKLPKIDDAFISALLENWGALPCPSIRLPQRYLGGLLFGQMIPRFDNRIIPTCRITGKKTPLKHCRAFYRYRWAMLVSNIQVQDTAGPRRLMPAERNQLHMQMAESGSLTKTELKKILTEITHADTSPLDQMFLTPEMEKALVFDPVKSELARESLSPLWKLIPGKFQKIFAGRLFHEQKASLADWQAIMGKAGTVPDGWREAVITQTEARRKRLHKKNREGFSTEKFLADPITIAAASGRAPYTRELMEKAFTVVFSNAPAKSDPKAKGGPLEETAEVIQRRLNQPIAQQTNNHLVRHRLLILERTLADLVKKYAEGDAKRIGKVTIEVVRDLQQFSGKSAKEKAKMLGEQLGHHRRIVEKLEEAYEESPVKFTINYGLIKKARVADDLGWKCPFTGIEIGIPDLLPTGQMDREHIIPKSLRPSDSLESLVITYKTVNRMKGQRTALQFMQECGGQPIPGLSGKELLPLKKYLDFVNGLSPRFRPSREASDDDRRCWRRKEFLLLETYDPRDADFTGRDLTQTAHLVKLANLQAQAWFKKHDAEPQLDPLAGSVTGATRKAWKVMGCLAQACPHILDERGEPRIKGEIRDITHLHHAVDAAVLALAVYYLPRDGNLWALLNRRTVNDLERKVLESTGQFKFAEGNRPQMTDLMPNLKQQITERLAEKRVVQHLPHKMSGLRLEQNMWGIEGAKDDDQVYILQWKESGRRPDGTRIFPPRKRVTESKSKLFGFQPKHGQGKLQKLGAAFIIKDNFGVLLDTIDKNGKPLPLPIPFSGVWQIVEEFGHHTKSGKRSRILRNGNLIEILKGRYAGRWIVKSIKDAKDEVKLNILKPEMSPPKPGQTSGLTWYKENVSLDTLLNDGLAVLDSSYVG